MQDKPYEFLAKAEFLTEAEYKRAVAEMKDVGARRVGKTFRTLLLAAHAASVGERVCFISVNRAMNQTNAQWFAEMFGGEFRQTTRNLFRVKGESPGFVLFTDEPVSYDRYVEKMVGNNTSTRFDGVESV